MKTRYAHSRAAMFALHWLIAAAPHAVETQTEPVARPQPLRPQVTLVLSGGGARGAAHVGVLKVLEELRVPSLLKSRGTSHQRSTARGFLQTPPLTRVAKRRLGIWRTCVTVEEQKTFLRGFIERIEVQPREGQALVFWEKTPGSICRRGEWSRDVFYGGSGGLT